MDYLRDIQPDTPRVYPSLLEGVKKLERERRFLLNRQPPYPRWVVWGKTIFRIFIPALVPVVLVTIGLAKLINGSEMYIGYALLFIVVATLLWIGKADDFTRKIPILDEEERKTLREGLGPFTLRRDVVSQFAAAVDKLRTNILHGHNKDHLSEVEDLHREVLDLRDFAGDANCYRGMKLLSKHIPHYDGSVGNDDDTRADHWYKELVFTFDRLTVLTKRTR